MLLLTRPCHVVTVVVCLFDITLGSVSNEAVVRHPAECSSVYWGRRYQDYQADDIPIVEKDGMRVRVMAGSSYGAEGPVKVCVDAACGVWRQDPHSGDVSGVVTCMYLVVAFSPTACNTVMRRVEEREGLLTQRCFVPSDAKPGDAAGRSRVRGRHIRNSSA